MTKVIHIKDAPKDWKTNPEFQYIGRAGKDVDGYFGNPFRMYDETDRKECLERFTQWFMMRLDGDEEYRNRALGLKGKTLICFCKTTPDILCHGDVIAGWLDGTHGAEQ